MVVDVKRTREQIEMVEVQNNAIKHMVKDNSEILEGIIHEHLQTGKMLTDTNQHPSYIVTLNNLILVDWSEGDIDEDYTNMNYLLANPDRFFFVSGKAITEIHFEDTLPVTKQYSLLSSDTNGFVIELLFKSERVKNRNHFIVGNKFRFTWSWLTNTMTVRKLNE